MEPNLCLHERSPGPSGLPRRGAGLTWWSPRAGGGESADEAAVARSQQEPTAGTESQLGRAVRAWILHFVGSAGPTPESCGRREYVHAEQAPPVPVSPQVSGAVLGSAIREKTGA